MQVRLRNCAGGFGSRVSQTLVKVGRPWFRFSCPSFCSWPCSRPSVLEFSPPTPPSSPSCTPSAGARSQSPRALVWCWFPRRTTPAATDPPSTVNYLCGRAGCASPDGEPRSLLSDSCVRRRPCQAWLRVRRIPVRCTQGSGWRNRAYPASIQTPRSRWHRFWWEMPFNNYATNGRDFFRSGRRIRLQFGVDGFLCVLCGFS